MLKNGENNEIKSHVLSDSLKLNHKMYIYRPYKKQSKLLNSLLIDEKIKARNKSFMAGSGQARLSNVKK